MLLRRHSYLHSTENETVQQVIEDKSDNPNTEI